VSGIAQRSRKPLECGGLTPPLWRYSAISLRLKGGVKPPHSKAPFGRGRPVIHHFFSLNCKVGRWLYRKELNYRTAAEQICPGRPPPDELWNMYHSKYYFIAIHIYYGHNKIGVSQ
jgi:hypothetical protein